MFFYAILDVLCYAVFCHVMLLLCYVMLCCVVMHMVARHVLPVSNHNVTPYTCSCFIKNG